MTTGGRTTEDGRSATPVALSSLFPSGRHGTGAGDQTME